MKDKVPKERGMSSIVKELSGIVRLKKGLDIKKDYASYLIKKYQMREKGFKKAEELFKKHFGPVEY
jgi:hypothetical protein